MNATSRNTITLSGVGKTYGRTTGADGHRPHTRARHNGSTWSQRRREDDAAAHARDRFGPRRGSIHLLGEDPALASGRLAVRRRLGYVPQETGFPRGFTAFGFVDYMAILKEWSDGDQRVTGTPGARLTGLSDVATKRISALSGGQRRRLVLAQAMIGQPDLLVLDEPTAGLDPEQRGRLRDVLGRAGESATVVISTHQTDDVAALCERVVVLNLGQVLFDGTVTDLIRLAQGRVWMADERHPSAQHAWRTGNHRIRNIGDPPPDAELIEPALEDAYLLLVGDQARR